MTRLCRRPKPTRPNICRLSIYRLIVSIRLTAPSTGPEFQSLVSPAVTASESLFRPGRETADTRQVGVGGLADPLRRGGYC
ncbi:hypothetical protein ACIQB5_45670 [Streptomyces sp. NPDC088560]|uniref:hypothetical protein n=1 Tax=Streptomyces sp. NPDC088560 TaxID=3365868 RepID=UPI0037FEFE5E